MRVVLDTNVMVSALLVRGGNEDCILRAWRRRAYELVTSPEILAELARVLLYPKLRKASHMTEAEVTFYIEAVAHESLLAEKGPKIALCRDPDDNKFLEAAVHSRARFLVTGDKDLLDLRSVRSVKIVRPVSFLNIL